MNADVAGAASPDAGLGRAAPVGAGGAAARAGTRRAAAALIAWRSAAAARVAEGNFVGGHANAVQATAAYHIQHKSVETFSQRLGLDSLSTMLGLPAQTVLLFSRICASAPLLTVERGGYSWCGLHRVIAGRLGWTLSCIQWVRTNARCMLARCGHSCGGQKGTSRSYVKWHQSRVCPTVPSRLVAAHACDGCSALVTPIAPCALSQWPAFAESSMSCQTLETSPCGACVTRCRRVPETHWMTVCP